ncbi:MAG: prolyl oligopeptidase family protein [Gammaproteobacteria bacterium]
MRHFFLPLVLALFATACSTPPSAPEPAVAKAMETDPFLWLEEVDGKRAMTWVLDQNKRSKEALVDDPRFQSLYDEALAILGNDARIPYGNIDGGFVYNFWQDTRHVRGIWRRASTQSFLSGKPEWDTLLDVDALAATEGRNWVYSGTTCLPPANELCLIELSDGGTDAAIYREYSLRTRQFVKDGFYVPQAKSGVSWLDEDHLLVASDFGAGTMTDSGYPSQVKLWERGQRLEDAPLMLEGAASDVGLFPAVLRSDDSAWPMVIQGETFFEFIVHIRDANGKVQALPLPRRVSIVGMMNEQVVAHLKEPWQHNGVSYPGDALVTMTVDAARNFPTELVFTPAPTEALEQIVAGENDMFVVVLDNVIGKLKRLTQGTDGWSATEVDLPANGTVSIASANGSGDDLLVSYESMTVPDRLYYVGEDDALVTVQSLPRMYDASDVVVEQRFATSRDGTRIPYFVMGKASVLARGDAPTIQYGYGGFQASIVPNYYADPGRPQHGALAGKLWVSRGGVMVLSNIRGGGEYGPTWHQAALKANRQRAFDDFFAIGEALIESGLTSADKLGAIGRSNGGLLMGAAMIQRPELYAAIDCGVPLLDMLRYHKLLAGASWIGEYGNPDVPEELAYIEAYSPYQALTKKGAYPDVLFYTSTKDDRVHPGHARKMGAKMAAYGHDFLYYENIEGGHGGTANQDQLAYRTAMEYMFFVQTLMR